LIVAGHDVSGPLQQYNLLLWNSHIKCRSRLWKKTRGSKLQNM